jgi:aryl-alcohol dehydrogenase-like predicted oxidoreductase
MLYGNLPGVSLPLSRLVFGTANPMMIRGENCFELLDAAYAAGVTTFDTALSYGDAEVSLGNWIHNRGLQGKVVVITKGCRSTAWKERLSAPELLNDLWGSLSRLRLDHIDVYLLHRDQPSAHLGPIIDTLNELQTQGTIGAFGCSNFTIQRIQEAHAYAASRGLQSFAISSPAFSLAQMVGDADEIWKTSVSLTGDKEAQAWYQENALPVLSYSGTARGFFSGRIGSSEPERSAELLTATARREYAYPANFERLRRAEILAEEKGITVPQVALAWLFGQPLNIFAVIGTTRAAHLLDSIEATNIRLTRQELDWLDLECE